MKFGFKVLDNPVFPNPNGSSHPTGGWSCLVCRGEKALLRFHLVQLCVRPLSLEQVQKKWLNDFRQREEAPHVWLDPCLWSLASNDLDPRRPGSLVGWLSFELAGWFLTTWLSHELTSISITLNCESNISPGWRRLQCCRWQWRRHLLLLCPLSLVQVEPWKINQFSDRVSEKVSTPTSILLMAINACSCELPLYHSISLGWKQIVFSALKQKLNWLKSPIISWQSWTLQVSTGARWWRPMGSAPRHFSD